MNICKRHLILTLPHLHIMSLYAFIHTKLNLVYSIRCQHVHQISMQQQNTSKNRQRICCLCCWMLFGNTFYLRKIRWSERQTCQCIWWRNVELMKVLCFPKLFAFSPHFLFLNVFYFLQLEHLIFPFMILMRMCTLHILCKLLLFFCFFSLLSRTKFV